MCVWKLVWQRTGMGRSRQETPKELLRSLLRGSQTGNSTSLSLKTQSQVIRPKTDYNPSGLSGRAWIFPSFAGKSRHCLKTTGILSRCQFMTVFANVWETEVEKTVLVDWYIYRKSVYLFVVCCFSSLPRISSIFKVISENPEKFTSLHERLTVKINLWFDWGQDLNP